MTHEHSVYGTEDNISQRLTSNTSLYSHPFSFSLRIYKQAVYVVRLKLLLGEMNMTKILLYVFISLLITACDNNLAGTDNTITEIAKTENFSDQSCLVALTPHSGNGKEDQAIELFQKNIRRDHEHIPYLERLGWSYIAKARSSFDQGFYRLAEQTALCMDSIKPGNAEALLLRGHVLHNLHQFKQSESLAKDLINKRGWWFDYALLGDVLMEQGRLDEAVDAYQEMMDQKPGPQAYSRTAHIRWLTGDLAGAIEMMEMASKASDARVPESAAWVSVRLAMYQLQQADFKRASDLFSYALKLVPDYPPALSGYGRLLMAKGEYQEAVSVLGRAVENNPLPEYQWILIDCLEWSGRKNEADIIHKDLISNGQKEDPRTVALYLATYNQDLITAENLIKKELEKRADIFTLDALAWIYNAQGKHQQAYRYINQALKEGTKDARLFYHAGVIASVNGHYQEAQQWFRNALAVKHLLLPSERDRFESEALKLNHVSQLSSLTWM